jgi:hypothetical protein
VRPRLDSPTAMSLSQDDVRGNELGEETGLTVLQRTNSLIFTPEVSVDLLEIVNQNSRCIRIAGA